MSENTYYKIKLDLVQNITSNFVHVMQYDSGGSYIRAEIFRDWQPVTVYGDDKEFTSAEIRLRKPDGKILVYNTDNNSDIISFQNNYIKIVLSEQMTVVNGSCAATIKLTDSSGSIQTALFILVVERNPVQQGQQSGEVTGAPFVRFDAPQILTDIQKAIARENIGAGSGSGAVDSVNGKTGAVVLDAADILLHESEKTIQQELAGKLEKITTASERERVYSIATNGTQGVLEATIYTAGGALCKRDSAGKTMVATPVYANEAANKSYVDTAIGAISQSKLYQHEIRFKDVSDDSLIQIFFASTSVTAYSNFSGLQTDFWAGKLIFIMANKDYLSFRYVAVDFYPLGMYLYNLSIPETKNILSVDIMGLTDAVTEL